MTPMATDLGEQNPVHNVRRIYSTDSNRIANALLDDGWLLLSVGQDPYARPNIILGSDNPDADAERVIGQLPKEEDPW
jgi:hypothetical protein